jgi:hypothetical protein
VRKTNRASPEGEARWSDTSVLLLSLAAQRPKNNHNKMMIGIGTPSSHSKIPRPIFVSFEPVSHQERQAMRRVPSECTKIERRYQPLSPIANVQEIA